MSDFLMVVPEGWIEVQNAADWLRSVDEMRIATLITENDWPALSQILEDSGSIAPNTVIQDARLIDAGDGPRFWYLQ